MLSNSSCFNPLSPSSADPASSFEELTFNGWGSSSGSKKLSASSFTLVLQFSQERAVMGSSHGLNVCTTSPDSTSTRTTCPELYPTASITLSGLQTIAVTFTPSPLLESFQTLLHDNLRRKTSPTRKYHTKNVIIIGTQWKKERLQVFTRAVWNGNQISSGRPQKDFCWRSSKNVFFVTLSHHTRHHFKLIVFLHDNLDQIEIQV